MTYVYPNGIRYTMFSNGDRRNIFLNGTVDVFFAHNESTARRTRDGAFLIVDKRKFLIYEVRERSRFSIGKRSKCQSLKTIITNSGGTEITVSSYSI